MSELNKLIEQFAKEEDTPAFMIHALIREVEDEKGTWLNKLLDWLATRPTCGKEQRLFLDEIEKGCNYEEEERCIYVTTERSESVLWQDEFKSDFIKVSKGE